MITLTIEFDPDQGSVFVQGPIKDRLFCYGLLELAKEAIKDQGKKDSNILIPNFNLKKGGNN